MIRHGVSGNLFDPEDTVEIVTALRRTTTCRQAGGGCAACNRRIAEDRMRRAIVANPTIDFYRELVLNLP